MRDPKCDNPRCPVCYPNWKVEEAAARKRAEDDKQDCIDWWRFYQKQAEAIVAVGDPVARNRRINAAYATLWLETRRFSGLAWPPLRRSKSAADCSMPRN